MSKKRLTYEQFKKYFGNRQEAKDRHAFEQKMMQDAFDEEAYDGLSQLSTDEMDADIDNLKNKIHQRSRKGSRTIPLWVSYAAGIALLTGIGLATLYIFDNELKRDMAFDEPIRENIAMSDTSPEEEPKEFSKTTAEKKQKILQDTAQNKQTKEQENISTTAQEAQAENTATGNTLNDELAFAQEPKKEETPKSRMKEQEEDFNATEEKENTAEEFVFQEETIQADESNEASQVSHSKRSINAPVAGIAEEKPTAEMKAAMPPSNKSIDEFKNAIEQQIQNEDESLYTKGEKISFDIYLDSSGAITKIKFNTELNNLSKQKIKSIIDKMGAWQPALIRGKAASSVVQIALFTKK